jgi:transposase InsO family protein
VGVKTLFIEPGRPWENGYVESFNGKLRDELLNGEIFYTLREAQVIIERWRREYNTFSSLSVTSRYLDHVLPEDLAERARSRPSWTESSLPLS